MNVDLLRRRHYTFEQVAERLKCDLESIRHLVLNGKLVPSYFFPGIYLRTKVLLPDQDYDQTGCVSPREIVDDYETAAKYDVSETAYLKGFRYLAIKRETSSFNCEFSYAASIADGLDIGDLVYELTSPMPLEDVMNVGFVMATELDRFLASNSLQQVASNVQQPTLPLTKAEVRTCDALPEPISALPEETTNLVTAIAPAAERLATAKSDDLASAADEKPLGTTERNTLLKLVIGMAIKGYRYDPTKSKNDATNEIANDIAALGMSVTDDTIRTHLKQAVQLVLPQRPSQP